jgi:hypothetical protein
MQENNPFKVIIEYLRKQVDPVIEPEKELEEEELKEKAASSSSSKTSLSSFQMPKLNMGTSQTKVMKLSLRCSSAVCIFYGHFRNPMTEKELAAAMEKHLLEDKLPLRERKFETLSDKEKFDRQAELEQIQRKGGRSFRLKKFTYNPSNPKKETFKSTTTE